MIVSPAPLLREPGAKFLVHVIAIYEVKDLKIVLDAKP